jgi:DNA-binding LacI/PurR family transcriptional regulator
MGTLSSKASGRVTIKSIARAAGLSQATVSRALNNRPDVDPATRQRVQAVAQDLGYHPSSLARSLVTQRTHTLGLAVRTLSDMWVVEIVPAIEELARNAGYEVFISTHYADPGKERRVLDTFRSRQVDGTLVISSTLGAAYPDFQDEWGMPIVLVSPLIATPHCYQVRSDDVGGARTATLHLLGLGHRRIGHIGVPTWSLPGADRLAGYEQALHTAALVPDPALVFLGDASVASGLDGAEALLSLPDPPTAFFCFNDLTAVGAMRGARSRGLHVPEDVSVVGFDDVALARYVDPPLCTIQQDMAGLGRRAMQMLLDLISGAGPQGPITLGTQLVERGSCARCACGC